MKYYTLKNDLREEAIGKAYPQTECLTMFQAQLLTSWQHFNPHPKLKFELSKQAVLTDFLHQISISSNGFLISERVVEIFKDFKLMDHQLFVTEVTVKSKRITYFWLHLSQVDLVKALDYQNTEFYRTDFTFREDKIQLASYQEYEEMKGMDKEARFGVEMGEVVLSDRFDHSLDMFTILPFDRRVYVSERLKEAFEEAHISGIILSPTDRIR